MQSNPSGPPEELEEFLRELTRHQNRLRALIRCLLFDVRDVEDVWQDTNVLLLRKSGEFQNGSNFWAWASTVARYQVLTHCKKKGRDRLAFKPDLIDLIAADVNGLAETVDHRREALEHCLHRLPSPQRQLLEIRYGNNFTLDQIAGKLSRPKGSIRQTLYRIRGALLKCIAHRLGDPSMEIPAQS
ncbi:sigma-70 family RNA polymerase sigma factor [Planctomicrobium sp. SH661]|uniref:sigma-70 family RNA polymerase sigma factor n=1 Tax=Planctomicrobium sp. SH661 TaxID=3448124 RepID=UPI003F5B158C